MPLPFENEVEHHRVTFYQEDVHVAYDLIIILYNTNILTSRYILFRTNKSWTEYKKANITVKIVEQHLTKWRYRTWLFCNIKFNCMHCSDPIDG
jgi:hypothetical protein